MVILVVMPDHKTKRSTVQWVHLGAKGLLSLMMLASAGMYLFKPEMAHEAFTNLGYPTYLVTPLAIAKLLGVVAIWSRRVPVLPGLAYAGFFYDFVLALAAHLMVGDGEFAPATAALVLLALSFGTRRRT